MSLEDPFHEGELAVQARAGETGNAFLNSRMIGPAIMAGALPFIAKQPWVIVGGADGSDRLWCSALVGGPGFAQPSPEGAEVSLDLGRAPSHGANPLLGAHPVGEARGLLFIELASRRRLRVNGRIRAGGPSELRLGVEESFPNCPKFIQKRSFEPGPVAPASAEARRGQALGEGEGTLVQAADTLFLATRHPSRGVDASHRGGRPGFVEVLDGRTLRWPDYPGNSLFQSFGNLEVDDRMGLLVPDFASGYLLHLSGRAKVLWDQPDPDQRTGGTGRFLEFSVETWVLTPAAQGTPRWTLLEPSPFNV